MIAITLDSPQCNVMPIDGGKILQFIDKDSGIMVNIPIPADSGKEIGEALIGSKIEVAPASALDKLKV